ncbi:MAG TPA: TRAP transporter small permease subunit [Deltaproteobacteria bacterium]|mgnify:CR=1 FL=1|nr:TRAP transporter small permease subunit [Deltaproteobacteria bacterium]HPJ95114.1 TRAP transporter small permease subunit [Deltaproteobacteria bacterium]HPR53011.1 TRAP transporter small permease subunit [Deltaproteobacteria bacterium]
MTVLKVLLQTIDKTNEWVARIVSYAIVLIAIATIYEVIMRYFFNAPTKWVFEFNYLLHGPYFLLVGAYAYAAGRHVNVDIVHARFSPRKRAIIDCLTAPVFFFFMFTMFYYGGRFALNSLAVKETLSSAWAPPIYPVKLCIPLAAALVILQGISKFIKDFHHAVTGREIMS